MSSIPPGPPPPPPPLPPMPPPTAAATGRIPWEEREVHGFGPALIETVKLFITNPSEAWRRTPERGEIINPLLFALIVSWAGAMFGAFYGMFFGAPWMRMLPAGMRDRFPMQGHAVGFVSQTIIAPIAIAIGLFVASAILHLCLMMVGGLASSTSGFDGTFRAVAYSAVADLANVIPFVGAFAAAVWKLVLVVMGFMALHKTSQGKAIAAVLIPVIFCCGCAVVAGGVIMGIVFGALNR